MTSDNEQNIELLHLYGAKVVTGGNREINLFYKDLASVMAEYGFCRDDLYEDDKLEEPIGLPLDMRMNTFSRVGRTVHSSRAYKLDGIFLVIDDIQEKLETTENRDNIGHMLKMQFISGDNNGYKDLSSRVVDVFKEHGYFQSDDPSVFVGSSGTDTTPYVP